MTSPLVKVGLVSKSSTDASINYALNTVRPFCKFVEQEALGFVSGLLGAEIKNPVYCLMDGISSVYNIVNKIFEEHDPLLSYMWRSIRDSTNVLNQR